MRSRTDTFPKIHHQVNVFFTTPHCGILAFELPTHPFLGLDRPGAQRGVAQLAHFFNQQPFDFIGRFQRSLRRVSNRENVLDPLPDQRLLAQLFDELDFLCAKILRSGRLVLHPNRI